MQTLYFPDYDDTLPQIDGFVDASYGNDLCPSIYSETLKLRIYCDYKSEAKREGCGMRYNVTIDDGTEALLETDDLVVVLEFIEIQRLFTALALARAKEIAMQNTKPQHVQLAEKFTELLRATLTPSEFVELADANANESDPAICHSHDYCDANQTMLDAMSALGIEYNDENTLWSDAWLHARLELFDGSPEKCRNGKPIAKCTCC